MNKPTAIYLKDYKKPDFLIEKLSLLFELFEDCTRVTNTMEVEKNNNEAKELVLDAIDLELEEIWLNDLLLTHTRYSYKEEKLTLFNMPERFTLTIKNIIYPDKNTELEGLYKSGSIFCTQNEPEGFRRITPYLDRPDVMSIYTTTLIADTKKYPVLLSNGNLVETKQLDANRTSVTWHDPYPKPSYLFAVVAGDLGTISDSFTTMEKRVVALNIYCDKGNESKCQHAMESLKKSMIWDENMYGRAYDLDIYNIVAVDSFNMGAMENKGLNVFNSHYVLADSDVATDEDFMGIESVIAHEYFHNWTGNRITCRDWFQLTLKEGLTVFRDQCFSADINSSDVQRIKDVKSLKERQFVEDASATAHPIQPESYISMNNFYTATVYEKGAEVIRMIHTLLGAERFRKGSDLYFETFDGQAVTTKDFLWTMQEASGENLTQFERWYHQSGTPKLEVKESFDDGMFTLKLRQIIPQTVEEKPQEPFYFPLKIALLAEDGTEVLEKVLVVSKEYEEFYFEGFVSKPVVSLNRDFSAPIIVQEEKTNYPFLMQHDKNGFVRYESAQFFALETIEENMKTGTIDPLFVESYGALLELDTDSAYKALLLELPTATALSQRMPVIDFEPNYEALESLQKTLAQTYKGKLLEIYQTHHNPKNNQIDAKSIGSRALKNRALRILSALESEEIITLAKAQYSDSLSMSDRIIALDILENLGAAEEVLEDFYARYKHDTLVMNKYLSIISASKREGTLKRVIEMQSDAVYDIKIPNLVRSLIGVFARNFKHFHAKDGSGYTFIAQKVLEIDAINAQMGSTLCGAFKLYEKLNPINRTKMQEELEMLMACEHLSKNSYEILTKILKK
ncbi:MAG: aminopeptidase N [Sulfurimonadaceae bacterium]|jgi:aminopeptidase N|nr:aminopeptidase N [Sulfurimonadaceae bacterium]